MQNNDMVPNSVSDEFLTYPLSNKKNDKFEFIHVSFMTENKRVDGIIRSFYEVQKKIPNVFLTLVGDGKCRKELETLTADLNISEHVHFTGMMARKDVVMKMNAADVFIMNSEHESFGVVLIEALALGKSVISTKSGGPDTIVTSDVGYLVDVDAPEKLTEFMIKITSERNKFRPNNIRKVCESRYSSKALVRRWKEIYMGILNTPFS